VVYCHMRWLDCGGSGCAISIASIWNILLVIDYDEMISLLMLLYLFFHFFLVGRIFEMKLFMTCISCQPVGT